ncbi:two-component sensor histidine kinase [Agromyces rhizosphaerae]|uniref:Two-component sensor histidine kinase n=1 Tax=Agromyces rhizosphaerae TaxID=88374 RepID=A0A9W6CZ60_9MICO|nr:sensor histidine kinase [Agromyces rhizosphaerae]GLI28945.1 two-component sensor histidine kinase [Agromyces rhizosphaerae]
MSNAAAKPPRPPGERAFVGRVAGAATSRAIRVGLAVITLVLLAVAAVRALADGTPAFGVITATLLFLGCAGAGPLLGDGLKDSSVAARWLGVLVIAWVVCVVVSPEYVWLAFPLWLLAGFILWFPGALVLSTLILATVVIAPVLHGGETTYAEVIGPLVGGAFAVGIARGYLELLRDARDRRRLIESLRAAQRETSELQDELARTQRETGAGMERTRLSRDIHDTVAQSLTSIAMLARAAQGSGSQHDAQLAQIELLAREGLADTRRIVHALAPSELQGSGLGDALRRMLGRVETEAGIRTDLRIDVHGAALSTAAEIALLRTTQSALANVRTHSRATRVVVSLSDAGDSVRLDVVDDGAGFDATAWKTRGTVGDEGGYGLVSMRARMRELGGDLEIESAPGDGTALSASVPRLASEGSR